MSKRIHELDNLASLTNSYYFAVDKSGNDEAYKITPTAIKNWINSDLSYSGTFDNGDLDGSYKITLTHSLSTDTPTVTVYDENGNYVDMNGVLVVDDSDNVTLWFGGAIGGEYSYKIVK